MGFTIACTPYYSELVPIMTLPPGLVIKGKTQLRPLCKAYNITASEALGKAITHEEVCGPDSTTIILAILQPQTLESSSSKTTLHPYIFCIHGGGLIACKHTAGLPHVADWAIAYSAISISVEYRLTPNALSRPLFQTATVRSSGSIHTLLNSASTLQRY